MSLTHTEACTHNSQGLASYDGKRASREAATATGAAACGTRVHDEIWLQKSRPDPLLAYHLIMHPRTARGGPSGRRSLAAGTFTIIHNSPTPESCAYRLQYASVTSWGTTP
eukprot:438486-Prymnesium_polylepis.1